MRSTTFSKYPERHVEINGKTVRAFDMSSVGLTGAISIVSANDGKVVVDIARGKGFREAIETANVATAMLFRIAGQEIALRMQNGKKILDVILPSGLTCLKTQVGNKPLWEVVPEEYMGSVKIH